MSDSTTYFIGFEDDEGRHRIGTERIKFTARRVTVQRGGTTLGALRRTYYPVGAFHRMVARGLLSLTKQAAAENYVRQLEKAVDWRRSAAERASSDLRDAQRDLGVRP